MPDIDEGRQSDLAVMSVEEFKQKRRMERILDARDNVPETRREVRRLFMQSEISGDQRNILFLDAVQEFVGEIRNLLIDYRDRVVERNEGRESGEAREYDRYWRPARAVSDDVTSPLGRIEMDHDDDEWFLGLHDVLWARDVYDETWTTQTSNMYGSGDQRTHREIHSVPMSVTRGAYQRANEFLDQEWDLDLEFEDEELGAAGWEFNEAAEEATERALEATKGVPENGDSE